LSRFYSFLIFILLIELACLRLNVGVRLMLKLGTHMTWGLFGGGRKIAALSSVGVLVDKPHKHCQNKYSKVKPEIPIADII
jgi:hypothetical protein